MAAVPPVAPVPFASVLYCQMVELETRIRASWRGLGTEDDTAMLAHITRRVDSLEDEAGPGMAWTPLDEVLARRAANGAAYVTADVLDWLKLAYARAGVPLPAGYRCTR